jgi:hypothetical protein
MLVTFEAVRHSIFGKKYVKIEASKALKEKKKEFSYYCQ